jgi:alpha-N-arabinofuranosidase
VKAADPSIHVVANGQDLRWNKPLVTRKGAIVQSVSQHTLIGNALRDSRDAGGVFESLMAYPTAYAGVLERLRQQMAPHVKAPRIAITELQLFTNVPYLPNNRTVAEALFLAGTIHTAVRAGDLVEMITHSALVNHAGGLHKTREIVYPDPVYYTTKLYATQPGTHPVGIRVTTPVTDVPARRGLPAVKGSPTLDAIALGTEDGKAIVLLAVNRHPDKPLPLAIAVQGWTLAPKARHQVLDGGMFGHNTWEHPDRVRLREQTLSLDPASPSVVLSPCSVNALTLRRAP